MRNKYKIFVIISVFIITLLLICASQSLSIVNTNTNDALTKARIKEIKSTKNTDISKRTGKIYYVSSSGNDYFYNGLSESTPWQSIDKVNNAFWSGTIKEGDTILFRRGDYFRGSLSIEVSDITLGSYGDESKPKPIISASTHDGAKEGSWVKVSGNVWKYTLNNSDQVFSKDIDEDIKNKVILDISKFINKNYMRQIMDGFDIKVLVKDTILINSINEQNERYIFVLNNSRLFTIG